MRRRSSLLVLAVFLCSSTLLAAETPDRNALLDQVVAAFDGEAMIETFLESMLVGLMGDMHVDDAMMAEMSAEDRAQFEQEMQEMRTMQRDFQQRVMLHLDGHAVAHDVIRPLLDETYTTAELALLLDFLKSEAGVKTVGILPELTTRLTSGLMFGDSEALREAMEKAQAEIDEEDSKDVPASKRTMADLRSMATATEAYGIDNEQFPDADTIAELEGYISPDYIREVPRTDGWGNDYHYIVSDDLAHYRFASAGPDGVFAWDTVVALDEAQISRTGQATQSFNDDIIYQDGYFLQWPEE